ncbi:hypothetical protein HPT25_21555 [Bacillus sp. BRMEA1]|uniref:hypothetical protein n=1 Tax=Neobacillus endophyticus TaxID=2738405 RepID=UPI0015649574|nr:hypothetical protein [Neobacillus endophyticus]NRD79925.1 hypothetical protein [Neobacillus endophyticus]
MKKIFLMIVMIFFFIVGNASASGFIELGKEEEVKEYAPKMFIYEALRTWMIHDVSDYYEKKYEAKSVGFFGPKPEKIRIWIKDIKPNSSDRIHTHIVRVYLPYEKVIINDKKEMKAADTFIYAINANLLSSCPESGKSEKEIKLIHSYHKTVP